MGLQIRWRSPQVPKKVPFPVPIHRGPFTNMYTLPAIHPFLPNPLLSSPSCLSPSQIMYTIHAWTSHPFPFHPIRPVNPLDQSQAPIPDSIRICAQTPLATPNPKAKPNQSTEKREKKKKRITLCSPSRLPRGLCVCVDWSMCDD